MGPGMMHGQGAGATTDGSWQQMHAQMEAMRTQMQAMHEEMTKIRQELQQRR